MGLFMGKTDCWWVVSILGDPMVGGWSNDLPGHYQIEAMRPLAEYIIANSIGGHPFRQIGEWIDKAVVFEPDESLHWPTGNYWATPLELLAVRYGDCEDHALIQASMLLALGYKAYAVIGAGHVWVEAQAENGLWYLLESCYGTVVSRSAERPDYYDPTIYITPDGCYEGNPTDDFPDVPTGGVDTIQITTVDKSIVALNEYQTVRGNLTDVMNNPLVDQEILVSESVDDAPYELLGKPRTGPDGSYLMHYKVTSGGQHVVMSSFPGTVVDTLEIFTTPSYIPSVEEVLALLS